MKLLKNFISFKLKLSNYIILLGVPNCIILYLLIFNKNKKCCYYGYWYFKVNKIDLR